MSNEHDWTCDAFHQANRCKACGLVSYDAELPAGPCTCAPSRWVPPGASEPDPFDVDAILRRMGEEYRTSLEEPLTAEEEAELQRLRVKLGLVDGGGA